MRALNYVLDDDNQAVVVEDVITWGRWIGANRKRKTVGYDVVRHDQSYVVSTVFLGLDHSWGAGPPLLFETMVFTALSDGEIKDYHELAMERYTTWAEAEAGHKLMMDKVRKGTVK